MPLPIKHTVFDIIEKAKSLTDSELEKALIKNNILEFTFTFGLRNNYIKNHLNYNRVITSGNCLMITKNWL